MVGAGDTSTQEARSRERGACDEGREGRKKEGGGAWLVSEHANGTLPFRVAPGRSGAPEAAPAAWRLGGGGRRSDLEKKT